VRFTRHIIAAAIVATVPSLLAIGFAVAQETMPAMEDSTMMSTEDAGNACGCRSGQQPPWHASVGGTECRPSCHPCGVFHADPCGQLQAKHDLHRHGCVTPPPCFPRLQAWWAYGSLPTPKPLAHPCCHQCGAAIEGGF
jgi:hypothetical protein